MEDVQFSDTDRQQMEHLGVSEAQVLEQIQFFRKTSFSLRLNRPCTLGDGVRRIPSHLAAKLVDIQQEAAGRGRFMKFVPASGAATRMFQSLLQIFHLPHFLEKNELQHKASQGVAIACDFLRFIGLIDKFAFAGDLREVLGANGLDLDELIRASQFHTILEFLLTERGLNYGSMPKALLKFHSYPDGSRTALEEHLAESALYMGAPGAKCPLHFTVPPEHESSLKTHMESAKQVYERRSGTCFEVFFSFQKSSTCTIAVGMDGMPFRDRSGRLHFRPAGHGALLENLNDLAGDLVYIKNVDNTVPDRLKEDMAFWKRILGGYLVQIQAAVHSQLRMLKAGPSRSLIEEAAVFAREELLVSLPGGFALWPDDRKRELLLNRLDRPIRVCGVVPNAGEPGGAPFWVEDENGVSIQIVEKAQVDFDSPTQTAIWGSSTHFNPVDVVCGLRDPDGKPYDLHRFVDKNAVIITKKSKDGTDIKALELPGLWNGGMAYWTTVLVEVPPATFNPVKSVYDLLRPEHQPD